MKLKLCVCCRGAKELWGAGMMKRIKCEHCKGAGWTEDPDEIEMDDFLASPVEIDEAPAVVSIVEETKPVVEESAPSIKPKYVRPSRAKKK